MSVAAFAPVPLSRVVARLQADGLLVSAPAADPSIRGVSDNSRQVAAGDLFCAWAGTSHARLMAPAITATGQPESRANPVIIGRPQSLPVSKKESRSKTEAMILRMS